MAYMNNLKSVNLRYYQDMAEVGRSIGLRQNVTFCSLGPEGSHSHELTLGLIRACGSVGLRAAKASHRLVDDMSSIVTAIEQNNDTIGILPIHNSLGGYVLHHSRASGMTNLEAVSRPDLEVLGRVRKPIEHSLLGLEDTADTVAVYSHPQALAQCAGYIAQRGLEAVDEQSTSRAARLLAARELPPGATVIASRAAGEQYGLVELERDIGDLPSAENITTMYVIQSRRE